VPESRRLALGRFPVRDAGSILDYAYKLLQRIVLDMRSRDMSWPSNDDLAFVAVQLERNDFGFCERAFTSSALAREYGISRASVLTVLNAHAEIENPRTY
jgi:hypothetical protein